MATIKLLEIESVTYDGKTIRRFQSQLLVGKDSADFIIEDEKLKHYEYGKNGFDFYEYDDNYEIVNNKIDMIYQEL